MFERAGGEGRFPTALGGINGDLLGAFSCYTRGARRWCGWWGSTRCWGGEYEFELRNGSLER